MISLLTEGALKEPLIKIGIVKKDEDGPSAILFAEGVACASWIKIPVGLIETVEYLMTIKCRDHEHPLVQVRFKETPDNEAARVFAELARRPLHPAGDVFQGARHSARRFNPWPLPPIEPEEPDSCWAFCNAAYVVCLAGTGGAVSYCQAILQGCRDACTWSRFPY